MKNKMYKLLSILLTVAIVFSTCMCAFGTVFAAEENANQTVTYLVNSTTGDDTNGDGITTPFKTIDGAIKYAILNAGLNKEGNTVIAKVADGDTVEFSTTADTLTAHNFKLIITSDNGATVKGAGTSASDGRNIILNGTTVFGKVTINCHKSFRFNDKDVTIGSDTTFGTISGTVTVGGGYNNPKELTEDQDIELNIRTGKDFVLGNDSNTEKTHNADINFTYDGSITNNRQRVVIGTAAGTTTYNKNLNFNIKSGRLVFRLGTNATFGADSAIQVINSANYELGTFLWNSAIECQWDSITGIDKWVLTNTTTYKDALSFTTETGKYKVNEGYSVKVFNAQGTEIASAQTPDGAQAGIIDISKYGVGEYTFTPERLPMTHNYYVGTGVEAPYGEALYATIDAAVVAANADADVLEFDTVRVNVLSDGVNWTPQRDAITTYDFSKLIVTSDSNYTVTTINTNNMALGGNTEFGYVTLAPKGQLRFYGFDVKISANTTLPASGTISATHNEPTDAISSQDLIFDFAAVRDIYLAPQNKTYTYEKDINVTFNSSAEGTQRFYLVSNNTSVYTTFNKNVNFVLKGSTPVELTSNGGTARAVFGADSAIQVIYDNAAATGVTTTQLRPSTSTPNIYEIYNKTGVEDAVSFIKDANGNAQKAKYQINLDTEKYIVSVKDASGNDVPVAQDGTFTCAATGKYTVTATRTVKETHNYYIKAGATDGNGSEGAPFATVAEVITAANANANVLDIDTVVVNILGTDTVNWGTTNDALTAVDDYNFDLLVQSKGDQATLNISNTKAAPDNAVAMSGDVEFKNVKITEAARKRFYANGHNVTFNSDVTLSGITALMIGKSQESYTNNQTVKIGNAYTGTVYVGNDAYSGVTFGGDVNIIVDNASAKPTFAFASTGGGTTTYNGNLKIDVRNATSVTFGNNIGGSNATAVANKDVQVLVDAGITVTEGAYENLKTLSANDQVYYVVNASDVEGAVEMVADTTGKFKVNVPENSTVSVTGPNGAVQLDNENCFTVTGAYGEYTVDFTRNATTHNYYVGTGVEAPEGYELYATIEAAVTAAKSNSDVKDFDTVQVNILSESVKWTSTGYGVITSHNFKLYITSKNKSIITSDYSTADATKTNDIALGGPTAFGNVHISLPEGKELRFYDQDVSISAETMLTMNGTVYLALGHNNTTPSADATANRTTAQNVSVGTALGKDIYLLRRNAGATYTTDINVTYNGAESTTQKFYFCSPSSIGTTTNYNRNVNFVIKGKGTVELTSNGGTARTVFGADSAIQVIYDNAAATGVIISQLRPSTSTPNIYEIFNKTGVEDAVSFIKDANGNAQKAKYQINIDTERYTVSVKDASGNAVPVAEDGTFTCAATGKYTVTATRTVKETYNYYIKAGATGGNGSEGAPFATVAEVITAANANANVLDIDTVVVNILTADTVSWGTTNDAGTAVDDYGFKLLVQSKGDQATLNISNTKATPDNAVAMSGDVEFKNVKITEAARKRFYANGHNVTFNSDVTFSGITALMIGLGGGVSYTNDQTVMIGTAYTGTVYVGNDAYHAVTFGGDVNIVVDNASAKPTFEFANSSVGNIYNGNLKIDVKNANTVTFGNSYTAKTTDTAKGIVQVLVDAGITVTDGAFENLKTLTANDQVYYVVNNSSVDGAVEMVADTTGKFKVNVPESYTAEVTGPNGIVELNNENCFSATAYGQYSVDFTRDTVTHDYYVGTGTVEGETVYPTVTDAIVAANDNDNIFDTDIVRVNVIGTETVQYSPDDITAALTNYHTYTLMITSENNVTVNFSAAKEQYILGDTIFDNIKITTVRTEGASVRRLYLDGRNVTFNENVTLNADSISAGRYGDGTTYHYDQTITFNNVVGNGKYIYLGDWYGKPTFNGNINVVINNPQSAPNLYIASNDRECVVNGDINVKLANGASLNTFANPKSVAVGGALRVISEDSITETVRNAISGVSATGGVYVVYNDTGLDATIDFTDVENVYDINVPADESQKVCVNKDGVQDSILSGTVLDLSEASAGVYSITVAHNYTGEETTYIDHIDYGTALNGNSALNNFAAKAKDGDVKVVYFGGSVTNGSNASINDKTSWRGLIGTWLENNTPNAKVTNINSAIGGTSTKFGSYRLADAVIEQAPDLLFVEFSINDYYDWGEDKSVDADEAGRRFETIIYNVRKALPNCDIVTVLTTEKAHIDDLKEGILHEQAQGHEAIAKAYGLPIIYVGKALAHTLSDNWKDNNYAEWKEYVHNEKTGAEDSVHPTDKGHRVYANVIQEFLANSVLGTDGVAAETVKAHVTPAKIVNEVLLDGDIQFIPADEALSEESVRLGGASFGREDLTADGNSKVLVDDTNMPFFYTRYNMSDETKVLKFKFTGTELSILSGLYSTAFNGVNVKIDGGEQFYKAFDSAKPTVLVSGLDYKEHTAEVSIAQANSGGSHWVYGFYTRNESVATRQGTRDLVYYAGGDGASDSNTGLEGSPVATIKKAVEIANTKSLTSEDSLTVMVTGTVNWSADTDAVPAHNYKLIVTSEVDGAVVTSVSGRHVVLGGKTEFGNVNLTILGYRDLRLNDYDVTFGADTTFTLPYGSHFALGVTSTTQSAIQNVAINCNVSSIYLANSSNEKTYDKGINVLYNYAAGSPTFRFGSCEAAADKVITYDSAVNFNIGNATAISLVDSGKLYEFGENGAIQVILNDPNTVVNNNLTTQPNKIYTVENHTGVDGAIKAVDSVSGQFQVNIDTDVYEITVTNKATSALVEVDEDGYFTVLENGTYKVEAQRKVLTHQYYVATEAVEGKTVYTTVKEAVEAAMADESVEAIDTVQINVLSESVNWSSNSSFAAHDFKIVVTSENGATVTSPAGENMVFGGKTEFGKINVAPASTKDLRFADKDVTFGAETTVSVGGTIALGAGALTQDNAQKVVINTNLGALTLANNNDNVGTKIYDKGIDIVYNNASGSQTFKFGTTNNSSDAKLTKYDSVLNFNIKAATAITLVDGVDAYEFGEDGAVQVILNNSEITFNADSFTGKPDKYYVVTNTTDSIIDFAGTGVFAVPDNKKFFVYQNSEKVAESEDGQIDLSELSGEFEVIEHKTFIYEITDNSTIQTVAQAVAQAKADGATANDDVIVKLVSETVQYYGADDSCDPKTTSYDFTVKITSDNNSTLNFNDDAKYILGDVIFDNVTITCVAPEGKTVHSLALFGKNVTFNSNVTLSGVAAIDTARYNNGTSFNEEQTIIFNNKLTASQTVFIGSYYGNYTYNSDVNIIVNDPTSVLNLSVKYGNTGALKGDVNLDLNGAKLNSISTGVTVGGDLRIIDAANLSDTVKTNIEGITVNGNKYVVYNGSATTTNAVDFTETESTLKVNVPDLYTGKVTGPNGNVTINNEGCFALSTAGDYTVNFIREAQHEEFTVSADGTYKTIKDAVDAAIARGFVAGDTVTVLVDPTAAVELALDGGSIPAHGFKLIVKTLREGTAATVTLDANQALGGDTDFVGITVSKTGDYNELRLNGANVNFDVNSTLGVNIVRIGNGSAKTEFAGQNIVIDGQMTTSNLYLGGLYADYNFTAPINISIANSTNSELKFNFGVPNNGERSYSATYSGVNIAVDNAKKVSFVEVGGGEKIHNGAAQVYLGNSSIACETESFLAENFGSANAYFIKDHTFQGSAIDFTQEVGTYDVNLEFEVTATEAGSTVKTSENGKLVLTAGVWTLTTNEYFEDFDDMTEEEFALKWKDTYTAENRTNGQATLVDGKLKVESLYNVLNKRAAVENINIDATNQFISVDVKGEGFTGAGGANIYARLRKTKLHTDGVSYVEDRRESYCLKVTGGRITVSKFDADGVESFTDFDLLHTSVATCQDGFLFGYNEQHTYRVGLSVVNVDDYALVRAVVINLNTNKVMFDETYKDNNPLTGTHIALSTVGSATPEDLRKEYCNTYFDNLYFSTRQFRAGDTGAETGDINYDGVYDIRDLVRADEVAGGEELDYNINMADKNYDGVVTANDLPEIREEILNGVTEFSLKGKSDDTAETLREDILGSTSTFDPNLKKYTVTHAGGTIERKATYNVFYVSSTDGKDSNDGKSESTPWTLKALNDNRSKLQTGDIVLFKRGDVFTLENPIDTGFSPNDDGQTIHAYIDAVSGVTYGAYGDSNDPKPLFKDSPKDYAGATNKENWISIGNNIWKYYAPEVYVSTDGTFDNVYDNGVVAMIFNKTSDQSANANVTMGQRREYTDEKYNLNKNGQFTYNPFENSDKYIYLYCDMGNPAEVYNSIEVTRATVGISLGVIKSYFSTTGVSNIVIDNLAFEGFGHGAVMGQFKNHDITVTNCTMGYSGGVQIIKKGSGEGNYNRSGNAVGIWQGGENFVVNNNWIYQTWDSAISPQGNGYDDYSGFKVKRNLLEYNNCDIEVFDNGTDNVSNFTGWEFSDNIMRFTSLGWGSRQADGHRGIQGVIRGGTYNANAEIQIKNNIIDSPGMEIFNFDNSHGNRRTVTIDTKINYTITGGVQEVSGYTTKEIEVATSIFEFGSSISGNTYYLNPYIRNISRINRGYMTEVPTVPADYVSYDDYPEYYKEYLSEEDGGYGWYQQAEYWKLSGYSGKLSFISENTDRLATNATEFENVMRIIDNNSTYTWYVGAN